VPAQVIKTMKSNCEQVIQLAQLNLLTYLVVFTFIILVYLISIYVTAPPTELSVLELVFGSQLAIFIVLVAIFAELSTPAGKARKR